MSVGRAFCLLVDTAFQTSPIHSTSDMELTPEKLLYVTQEVGVGGPRAALEHGQVQHSVTQVPPADPRAGQAAV